MEFKPERFIDNGARAAELDPYLFSFGFGRRICPGKDLADATLFITIAMVLAVFDIRKRIDVEGRAIDPLYDCTPGPISHPKDFECDIRPRSQQAILLVQSLSVLHDEYPSELSDSEKVAALDWREQ